MPKIKRSDITVTRHSVKTWKTRPNNCKMPYKYGMYEYGYIEFVDGTLTSASPEPVVILGEK